LSRAHLGDQAMNRQQIAALIFLLVLIPLGAIGQTPPTEPHELYPDVEPFQTGYLKVSDLHEIYYELCGNPDGRPVMILHGGPGGGSYPELRRYHDPEKYLLVLHDQRGAGRSKPHCELRENTTQNLVEDIEKLRRHLKLDKVQVFGGSWGSTLGLAYTEAHPDNVSALVIRGVFTATQAEIDHFYHGGVSVYFPEVYAKLQSVILRPEKHNYPAQLLELLQSPEPEVRRKTAHAWAAYEIRVSRLETNDDEVAKSLERWDPYDFALIENYYMANNCFLEEGQLLREARRMQHVPTFIVQGRYDAPCPPINAYRLHKALPNSKLIIVEASGHAASGPRARSALIDLTKSLK
jgi:proline iminopeptidase